MAKDIIESLHQMSDTLEKITKLLDENDISIFFAFSAPEEGTKKTMFRGTMIGNDADLAEILVRGIFKLEESSDNVEVKMAVDKKKTNYS